MQTFVPANTYRGNAIILDNKRLHKQALEGWQILMVLVALDPAGNHREPKGWVNHPAVKMWRGHEIALASYSLAMVKEWKSRGFKSTLDDKILSTMGAAVKMGRIDDSSAEPPAWLGDPAVHSSHRKALLVKNYAHYSRWEFPEDPGHPIDEYEYVWPVN